MTDRKSKGVDTWAGGGSWEGQGALVMGYRVVAGLFQEGEELPE